MTNYFIKFIKKRNDRGWFKDSGTQCNTISEYTELYSGPDYQIYIKYAITSDLLNETSKVRLKLIRLTSAYLISSG